MGLKKTSSQSLVNAPVSCSNDAQEEMVWILHPNGYNSTDTTAHLYLMRLMGLSETGIQVVELDWLDTWRISKW